MIADTLSTISVDSPEGRKFLRRVARKPSYGPRYEAWRCEASEANGWKLTFHRKVEPSAVGDPEITVTVETDVVVGQTGETGLVRPFADAHEVVVPKARRLWCWEPEARAVAKLLLDGATLSVQYSSGSSGSSRYGIAEVSLIASLANDSYVTVTDSLYVNGSTVCGTAFSW